MADESDWEAGWKWFSTLRSNVGYQFIKRDAVEGFFEKYKNIVKIIFSDGE